MKKQNAENLENLEDELFEAIVSLKSTKERFYPSDELDNIGFTWYPYVIVLIH